MNKKAFLISVIVMGILLSVQVRSFQKVTSLIERGDEKNLLSELRLFQRANEQLRAQVQDEQKTLEEARTKISQESLEDELKTLRALSGEEAVVGEGIEVAFNRAVNSFWVTDMIAQLVSSGAEAVSINDRRLSDETAGLRDVGSGFLMRNEFLRPPFHLSIIGPQKELRDAIAQNGGIIDRMQKAYPGITIFVTEKEKLYIPALPQ